MKKITSTFLLIFVLSFSIIADDGTTHSGGGKSCPQPGQTNCFAGSGDQSFPDKKPFYKGIFDFLESLFG